VPTVVIVHLAFGGVRLFDFYYTGTRGVRLFDFDTQLTGLVKNTSSKMLQLRLLNVKSGFLCQKSNNPYLSLKTFQVVVFAKCRIIVRLGILERKTG